MKKFKCIKEDCPEGRVDFLKCTARCNKSSLGNKCKYNKSEWKPLD